MTTDAALSPLELTQRLAAFPPSEVVDVRREPAFVADAHVIRGALRRAPEAVVDWARAIEPWRAVVVYCAHGREIGRSVAEMLRMQGFDARFLAGGLDAWRAAGYATTPWRPPTRWVTRERPKIDRIACPWLVRRFIDPAAEFFYVPASDVRAFAAENDATAFDIPEAPYGHVGAECSFDAFLRRHELRDPALSSLAAIVRAADTSGLLAVSRGLSTLFADDHAMLRWGMLVYDALYAQCRTTRG